MKVRFLNGCMALMLTGIILTGCEKRNIYNPDEDNNQPQGEYFDFSTSQKVKMNISYDVPEGYRVAFDVYDQLPMVEVNGRLVLNTELNPIASGITDGYGKYDLEKVLPAAVKEFYVYTPDLFATTLLHGTILGNNATLESIELSDLQTKAVTTKASSVPADWIELGSWTSEGKPDYMDSKKQLSIYSSTLSNIKWYFPEGEKVNSIYYTKNDLYVAEDAEMWLTVIGSLGEYKNSLGYYCYTGKAENQDPKNLKKILAIPCAKEDLFKGKRSYNRYTYNCVQLQYCDPETGKLSTKFPKGTTIGFVLISNGFNQRTINYSKSCFYSYPDWNPEKGNNNHMILFKTKNNGEDFVAFGFEDQNNNEGDKDCNDVMFHIIANPLGSITEEIPEVPETDKDVYKDEVYRGTLAFEDLWPMQGDYDLNDVVVKYKSTATTVVKSSEDYASYGKVIKVKDEFSLIWSGALYHNGFGYQMSVDKSNVKSLKVTRNGEELATAWDKDLDKVTIMLSDDILSEIGESTGNVVNYTVELEFAEPILVKEFNEELAHAPYNPFIVAKGGLTAGRVEVHLPMYAPTAKNNMDLLGTGDDKSDVAQNRYYASEQEFPFAIHIFGDNDFINKEEGIRIDEAYPKYRNWVEKLGKEDADWYKYPKN